MPLNDPSDTYPHDSLRRTPSLCAREKISVFFLSLLIIAVPWGLGGINVTAQFVNLGLALLAFATLFIPLSDGHSPTPGENFKRLLCSPFFWLGLLFLGYLLVQYYNPHMVLRQAVRDGRSVWWMQNIPYIAWLPSGVDVPYYPMNSLRFFVMWATPILMACVLHIGIKRSASWRTLMWVCVINAAVLSLVGLGVRASDTNYILGFIGPMPRPWQVIPPSFFGPFVNPNHASVYLYLNLAVAAALFFQLRKRAIQQIDRSGKHWFLLFPMLIFIAGASVTGSRAGIVGTAGIVLFALLLLLFSNLKQGAHGILKVFLAAMAIAAVAGGVLWSYHHGKIPYTVKRLATSSMDKSIDDRSAIWDVSMRVAEDRWVQGWGAGAFAYVSQPYLKNNPAFLDAKNGNRLRRYVAHAHCDWIELPADIGVLGCLPLAAMALCWLGGAVRYVRSWPLAVWILLAGLGTVAVHAAVDFPLSAPAIQLLLILIFSAIAFLSKAAAHGRT